MKIRHSQYFTHILINSGYYLLILFASTLQAEDKVDLRSLSLEELLKIQISTGTSVALNKAPAVASIITANDIKAMGALTIDEVLVAVPGLHVSLSTLNRLIPSYTFRGIYTGRNAQVMFMLNGHRIYGELYSGGISYLARMNVNNISKIEIVRGPGSAVYGADAYSGVINIITKDAAELNGFNFGLRTGSQHTRNVWMQYGTTFGDDWDLALNLEYFKRDSDKNRLVKSDFQTFFDQSFGSSASMAPTYLEDRMKATTYNLHLNNNNWEIALDGYINQDSGVGAGAAQAVDHEGFDDYSQSLFSLTYQNDTAVKNWRYEANLSYFQAKFETTFNVFPSGSVLPVGNDGNIFTPHNGIGCLTANIPGIGCLTNFEDGFLGNPDGKTSIPTVEAIAHYEGWDGNQLRFNIGIKNVKFVGSETKNFGPGILDIATLNGNPNPINVDGTLTNVSNTPYVYVGDTLRKVKYLSIQDIWRINNDWTLTAGLRYDNYSDFGSTTNPRLALVWNTSDKLITKLLYGGAFRAPSASELYVKNNPIALGNINLKPETIETTELAFSYKATEMFTINLNLYSYATKDMIEYLVNSEGVGTSQNNQSLSGQGLELETKLKISEAFNVVANYANQSTKNDSDNLQVEFVPQQQFYMAAQWQFDSEWLLSSQFTWVSDRDRTSTDTRAPIANYQSIDLTLRSGNFSFGNGPKNWEFSATIKNLLDNTNHDPSDGKIPDDYPLYGRRIYSEIRYYF